MERVDCGLADDRDELTEAAACGGATNTNSSGVMLGELEDEVSHSQLSQMFSSWA